MGAQRMGSGLEERWGQEEMRSGLAIEHQGEDAGMRD